MPVILRWWEVINVGDDAAGLEMVDTFSVRHKTGNAYSGI